MDAPVINMPANLQGLFKEVYADAKKDKKAPKYFKKLREQFKPNPKPKK